MKQESGFFESFDQTKLFYRTWLSEKPNARACLIIHGYGEHSGRYNELVNALSEIPMSFFSFDLRGQGKSDGRRVDVEFFDDFVRDAESYLMFLQNSSRVSNQPIALLGHSLGGLIAIKLASRLENRLNKLVLSSPFLSAHGAASLGITFWLATVLNRLIPDVKLPGPVKPNHLFHGAEKMREYLADTLIERRITTRLAHVLLSETRRIRREEFSFKMPLLILASGDDRIVSLPATKAWFEKVAAPKKELKIYDGFYHEIFHEIERTQPIEHLKQFLK